MLFEYFQKGVCLHTYKIQRKRARGIKQPYKRISFFSSLNPFRWAFKFIKRYVLHEGWVNYDNVLSTFHRQLYQSKQNAYIKMTLICNNRLCSIKKKTAANNQRSKQEITRNKMSRCNLLSIRFSWNHYFFIIIFILFFSFVWVIFFFFALCLTLSVSVSLLKKIRIPFFSFFEFSLYSISVRWHNNFCRLISQRMFSDTLLFNWMTIHIQYFSTDALGSGLGRYFNHSDVYILCEGI